MKPTNERTGADTAERTENAVLVDLFVHDRGIEEPAITLDRRDPMQSRAYDRILLAEVAVGEAQMALERRGAVEEALRDLSHARRHLDAVQ